MFYNLIIKSKGINLYSSIRGNNMMGSIKKLGLVCALMGLATSAFGEGDFCQKTFLKGTPKAHRCVDCRDFAEGQYRQLLNRHSDPGGLDTWTNECLKNGRSAVVLGIKASAEYATLHPAK